MFKELIIYRANRKAHLSMWCLSLESWLDFEPELPVTLVSKDKSTVVVTVEELLPYSFTDLA